MAVRRFKYRMHHTWVTAGGLGYVQPFFHQEVTPGDTWRGHTSGILRMAPLDQPVMTAIKASYYYFFVPHRIVWDEFEDFITGKSESSVPTIAMMGNQQSQRTQLYAQLGLNINTEAIALINALPIRAYNTIWNEFFRDQAIDPEVSISNQTILQARFTPNTYHTSARSEVQQNDEAMIPVINSEVSTIDLRNALHEQRYKERRSQYGERYHDYLMAMGLRVPDSRLDRPEFVGRGHTTLGISEVVSTAQSAEGSIGEYKGHGIAGVNLRFAKRMFIEHGTLMGLVVFRPRFTLHDKIDYKYNRLQKYDDFFQQEMATDAQTTMVGSEINAMAPSEEWDNIVGYQPRYEWLRHASDVVAGSMLDDAQWDWHTSIKYGATTPGLDTVITVPPYVNIFQDEQGPKIYQYYDHQIAKRSIVPRRVR